MYKSLVMSPMRHLEHCKICASSRLFLLKKYQVTPRLNVTWAKTFQDLFPERQTLRINLVLCGRCGFIFYQDVFEDAEIEKLYANEGRYETGEMRNMKPGRRRELRLLTEYFEKVVPLSEIHSIIDVGAGDFEILNRLMERHGDKQYTAIDPSFQGDVYRGARVLHDMVEKSHFTESHDLVMMTHILEHVVDLERFMQHVLPLIKKYVYVEVPFQVGPSLFLNRSVNSQHINYFSPEAIQMLLERFGLEVIALRFENDWYRHNGMPGMIRLVGRRNQNFTPKVASPLSTLGHLLSPWPLIKSFVFSRR